jgi:hypothetical protein
MIEPISNITFNEEYHQYKIDGKPIKSVSHFLKPISMQVYETIDEDILRKAAERGTSIHFSIELFNTFGVNEIHPDYLPYLEAYKKWAEKYLPIVQASEFRVYHPLYWYAGTADLICEIFGKMYVIDLKTTADLKGYLVSLQLAAYAEALKQHGIKIEAAAVLHIKKDGNFTFKEYNINENFNVFLQCLNLQNYINKELKI